MAPFTGCSISAGRATLPASDKETPWEIKVNKLPNSILIWKKLKDFDRRNMVGRYAGLIYRVADGKALREPLEQGQRLVNIVPVYEDQLKVTKWFSDLNDERYGLPEMFEYLWPDRQRSLERSQRHLQLSMGHLLTVGSPYGDAWLAAPVERSMEFMRQYPAEKLVAVPAKGAR